MNQAPQNMDHLNETMLYKCPGPHEFHGGRFDYVIVPEADIEEAKAQGWHLTTKEASAAHDKQKADEHQAIMQQMEREAAIETAPPALPIPAADLVPSLPPASDTAHLLATQANATHLETSIEQANAGQVQVRELVDNAALEAPVTYDEMKTKATQLGLEYPGNISKAALLAMITAKLAEKV